MEPKEQNKAFKPKEKKYQKTKLFVLVALLCGLLAGYGYFIKIPVAGQALAQGDQRAAEQGITRAQAALASTLAEIRHPSSTVSVLENILPENTIQGSVSGEKKEDTSSAAEAVILAQQSVSDLTSQKSAPSEKTNTQKTQSADKTSSVSESDSGEVESKKNTSGGMLTIDFDDGWQTQYTKALPVLEDTGIPATFYIIAEPLQKGWSGYMTPKEVKNLSDSGYDIESHTVTHPHLTKISSDEVASELKNAKEYLENLTGEEISLLSYPYGEFNQSVIDTAKQAGYRGGRTTNGGENTPSTDPFRLRATSVEETTSLAQVKSWIDKANQNGGWLIVTFHHIGESGNEYNASPSFLRQVIEYAQSTNIKIVSEKDGMNELGL
ncbi:MAG TPA: polysaccharide deacetylase family protein [Candidatus Paceibacterota bacterium]|nr:polysaccharide deacetylase family protein [Candidatus Paceibacterota bacterium]